VANVLLQLRDGSTLSAPLKHQAGVPPARTLGGRLPGGACIPPLLEAWKHKILLAGKYLNVIRECGIDITHDQRHLKDDLSMTDERSVRAERPFSMTDDIPLQLLSILRGCLHTCKPDITTTSAQRPTVNTAPTFSETIFLPFTVFLSYPLSGSLPERTPEVVEVGINSEAPKLVGSSTEH